MSDEDMVVMPVGQTVTIDLPAEEHWWVSSELMPDGSTRHERADGRVIVVRPAPTETIDGTAAEYPGTLTAEARAERAEAQLAALREAVEEFIPAMERARRTQNISDEADEEREHESVRLAMDASRDAAEAHDRRVRAEALREAADALRGRGGVLAAALWLRARADEIERAR